MVVTKMELQRLKEKLPNISIRYTGTWKDSLKFGVGMAATAAGIILALLGCGSEILTGGVSTAVSVPAAASGIAIAGTGLAISGSALANMFDVRIQKSESSKGDESGKNIRGSSQNYMEQLDDFSENKIDHMVNGSKGSNHNWEKLVPDKNWNDIKNIVNDVMENGEEGPYKSVFSKKKIIDGYEVEVTYNKLSDGTVRISDAWINP